MANIKQLMEGHQRFQKESTYVKGNLNPTSVKNAIGRADVGGGANEMSQFLGALLKAGPKALDAHNRSENEKNEKLKKEGYLDYKSAKPSSLKAFRENSPKSENPYYKWGVDTADAEVVLQEKGRDFEKAYGEWKFNRPKVGHPAEEGPQTYQQFVDGWIEENQPDIGDDVRNPIIMGESFWPGMDALIGAKGKDNAQHEAKIYEDQTQRKLQASITSSVDDPTVDEEMFKGFASTESMLAYEQSVAETTTLIEQMAFNPKNVDPSELLKAKSGQTDLLHEIIGNKIASSFGSGHQSQDNLGEVTRSQSDTIALTYETLKSTGFKDDAKGKRKSNRKTDKKQKKSEVPPAIDAQSPEQEVQTWGVFSHMNKEKTEVSFTKFQEVWDSILNTAMSETNLPKETIGKLVLKPYVNPKTGKKGSLQVQFEMPPEAVLEQYPEAREFNKNLLKSTMEKGGVTTPLYNNGITKSHGTET
jgi:hypothetical protein